MSPYTDGKSLSFAKIVLIGLLAIVVVLLISGRWVYLDRENRLRSDAENILTSIARLKANQITEWRSKLQIDASILMEDAFFAQIVIKFLVSPDDANAELIRARFHTLQSMNQYMNTMLVDAEGSIRLDLLEGSGSEHLELLSSLTRSFREHRPVLSDLHKSSTHSSPHLLIVAPFFTGDDGDRTPVGAAIFVCDAETFLYPLIKSWPIPSQSAETLLVERDGNDVLFLNDLRNHADAALALRIPLSRTEVPSVMAILGKTGLMEGIDYRGVKVISVLQPVPDSPWFMISKVDAAEALATMRRESFFILLTICGLVVLAGAVGVAVWQQNQKRFYLMMYKKEAEHGIILNSIGDGVIVSDDRGRVNLLNPTAERMTGWTHAEAKGRPLEEIFRILNEDTRKRVENPVSKVLQTGTVVNLANHSLLIAKDGSEIPLVDSGAPIRDEDGKITGVVLIFRDQAKERLAARQIKSRLAIIEYAATHSLDELLTYCLDEISAFASSPIAFIHFVESDQRTLSLQQWSTRTLNEFCKAEGRGVHYNIDLAGVWGDCIEQKRPVIHNDYEALTHKKGLPPGHAPIIRELVVPVLRKGRIVAILGVGNKSTDYTDNDLEIVSYFADITWETVKQQMAQSENERLRAAIEQAGEMISITDSQGTIQYVNPAFETVTGYSSEELLGKNPRILKSGKQDTAFYHEMFETLSNGKTWHGRMVNKRKDGSFFTEDATISPVLDTSGKILNYVAVKRDISVSLMVEAQLQQAQKMEAIGTLAGGIAHDFNNILGAILGYAEMVQEDSPAGSLARGDIDQVVKASHRAKELVKQILNFSRQAATEQIPLHPALIIKEVVKMLRSSLPSTIDIHQDIDPEVGLILADPTQIHQVLMNLCTNAFHAMEQSGGTLTISLKKTTLSMKDLVNEPQVQPGDFVQLSIGDTGSGIAPEIQEKMFDPFFTTKEVGKGTGMGLAIIHGMVKNYKGFVTCHSQPGEGTVFQVYLPVIQNPAVLETEPVPVDLSQRGNERILFIDDEEILAEVGKAMLERLGYQVTVRRNSIEALNTFQNGPDQFDLVITDQTMPGMTGSDLARRMLQIRPGMPIILCTGYSSLMSEEKVCSLGIKGFAFKPLAKNDLAALVRKALNGEKLLS